MVQPIADQDFARVVGENISIAAVLRALGRAHVGSNYKLVHRTVKRLGLDTSHWKGMAHGRSGASLRSAPGEVLVEHGRRTGKVVKDVYLRSGIPYRCTMCGLGPEWNGKPLVLRLDHRNGIRDDSRIENLRLLCPNCDSQTETYCGRNKRTPARRCNGCRRPISAGAENCSRCSLIKRHKEKPPPTKIRWPSVEELQTRIASTSNVALGRELGVSVAAIKKHIKKHAPVAQR